RVKVGPGQIDQVLMNLVVNARDAMPEGGRLTIGTRAVVLEEGQAVYPDLAPGRYALLSVADTGCGMTDDVKARRVERFSTTKGPAKGPGRGLAMVFGIVKQAGGHIAAASEVGAGTTFTILLPAVEEASPTPGGPETVLLVEDEGSVRDVARRALES